MTNEPIHTNVTPIEDYILQVVSYETAVLSNPTDDAVVTPENHERIRNEVRQLRDDFDTIHDEANLLLAQVETLLIQKTSIEESYT